MITLLERLEVAERAAGRSARLAGERDLRLLGWDRICEQIAVQCHNARAAESVRRTLPFADLEIIALLHGLADELRPFGEVDRWPPVVDVDTVAALLERPAPRRLEGPDLVAVAGLAESLDSLRDHFLQGREAMPRWADAATQTESFATVSGEIRRCLDREGHLVDSASPLLGRLRRGCAAHERLVRQAVGDAMQHARSRGIVTGDEVTLRGDRFCLPVRSGERRQVDGIVHDRSGTGATLFIEPAPVVHLSNELAEMRLEMAAEETRLLLELNRRVEQAAPALLESAGLMLRVDRVRAGMRWSKLRRASRPHLASEAPLRVAVGRHPLLEASLREQVDGPADTLVPLQLELPPEAQVLLVSGPNAGGKSVALKTVGVFVLLAQSGWDVPAREDTSLPLFNRVCVDLGDEQSIEAALSSFSARLTHLKRFLEVADRRTLVILDEIGTGTDPQEGAALAFTALERFADRGARVLASTHFGLLKAAAHDHPVMLNAAMDYDEQSLRPLFTLRLGDPGTSHAFDIAGRVGLDGNLLRKARARVGEERVQVETLLADLGRRARDLAAQQAELTDRLAEQREKDGELERRLRDIDRERRRELEEVRRRGEDLLKQARAEIEQAVREIRSAAGDRVVVRRARDRAERLARDLPAAPEPTGPPLRDLEPGEQVRVPHLGLRGRVVEVRGEKITVLADGLRLTVGQEGLERLTEPDDESGRSAEISREQAGWTFGDEQPDVPHELDLRGYRVEEGWEQLDRLLDRALPVGLSRVTVIHGMGTGRLREHLLERLRDDPRVKSFGPAGAESANYGATVIELAG